MFQFFFKYPSNVFAKGKFVLLSPWPVWLMILLLALAAGGLLWNIRQRRGVLSTARSTLIWLAQTALIAIILLMLWHPAISVARLRPQQNVVVKFAGAIQAAREVMARNCRWPAIRRSRTARWLLTSRAISRARSH